MDEQIQSSVNRPIEQTPSPADASVSCGLDKPVQSSSFVKYLPFVLVALLLVVATAGVTY